MTHTEETRKRAVERIQVFMPYVNPFHCMKQRNKDNNKKRKRAIACAIEAQKMVVEAYKDASKCIGMSNSSHEGIHIKIEREQSLLDCLQNMK